MDVDVTATHDELAGVVDLFGGLTRDELERALMELAYREGGQSVDGDAAAAAVDDALAAFALVEYDRDGETLLVAGPRAFPSLPAHAEDLPHILDVEQRSVDRESLGTQVEYRFRELTSDAVEEGDTDQMERLLDASYDVEAWAPVDLESARTRIDDELEQ